MAAAADGWANGDVQPTVMMAEESVTRQHTTIASAALTHGAPHCEWKKAMLRRRTMKNERR